MFIYSVRSSTVKLFGVILIALLCVGIVIGSSDEGTVYASSEGKTVNYGGMETKEDRIAFIESFGLRVDPSSETEESYRLPGEFDRVLSGYNQLQLRQGLDLTKYKNRKIRHFSYKVTNYDYQGECTVNLYIIRSRIIGCDLSSTEGTGFVLPLLEIEPDKLK